MPSRVWIRCGTASLTITDRSLTEGAPLTDLTPAEAAGWQIMDGLDEDVKAKLYKLIGQAEPD